MSERLRSFAMPEKYTQSGLKAAESDEQQGKDWA
jgi:hypothetical protein